MLEAIVPVRGLPAGKTRLAALLDLEQRNRLVRAMLADVVEALRAAAAVDRVTILSRDAAAAREAERLQAGFLSQPPEVRGLNAGLAFAQRERAGRGALLIVPADLPLIGPEDVDELLARAGPGPAVVIAPSRDGGTNGLLLRPGAVIAPAYGPGSAERHGAAAVAAGVQPALVDSGRWALDIDDPEDVARFLALVERRPAGADRHTTRCLRAADFPDVGSAG